jgi:hypothetical protein
MTRSLPTGHPNPLHDFFVELMTKHNRGIYLEERREREEAEEAGRVPLVDLGGES